MFVDIAGHPFPVGLDDGGGGGSDRRRGAGEDSAEPVDGPDGGAEDGAAGVSGAGLATLAGGLQAHRP
ncbi:hypothetical protein KCW65_23410, partial [Mycobacterium tuberculosis]|nr:hypothetical protein [Mycobacterium tuberculosis]